MTVGKVLEQGIDYHRAGDFENAVRCYDAVLGKLIHEPYTLHCLGTLFLDRGLCGIAMQLLMRSVQLAPEDAPYLHEAYLNLGVALRNEAHEEEAAACYRRGLSIKDTADGWCNLAGCYVNYGKPEKCVEYATKALEIDPNHKRARKQRALGLLELGRYKEGFSDYEARLEIPEFHDRKYPGYKWDGRRVNGTLVIHGEQGLGDEVMFCSLVDRARLLCDRLVIECSPRLVSLFRRSFAVPCYGTDEEVKSNEDVKAFVAMGSLPHVFGIETPLNHSGYLKAEKTDAFQKKGFRIGVSWRGGTKKTHEQFRNFPLDFWKPLFIPGFEWTSVQYGDVAGEVKDLGLVDPCWDGDMDEFASLIESCDLVITVCNTTVHVAGALNKPCWVLVPTKAAWRYGLTGEKMLFYPSVKMYRQADEPWSKVIERISSDLRKLQGAEQKAA